jgi:hypothetical protein
MTNAALWLGASIFGTFVALPTFFTPEMKALIPAPYNGFAAQMMLHRYLSLHYACAIIAILHLFGDFVYLGRRAERRIVATLAVIVVLGVLEGAWIEPRLKSLFAAKYNTRSSPAERQEAGRLFGPLHGLSQVANLIVIIGVGFYFWEINIRPTVPNRPKGSPLRAGNFQHRV